MLTTGLRHREFKKNRQCENASDGLRMVSQIPVIRTNTWNEAETQVFSLPYIRIVLLGKSGVGKSAAGNTILRQKVYRSEMSVHSVTRQCSAAQATVSGRSVSVVDTPGLFDTQMSPEELMKEIARCVYFSSPGPHAFLIVISLNIRFTERELQIPQMIEQMFGEEVLKYSIILFTHGDLLDGESVEKLIEENSRLRSVVQQCGGRYHVFNNRDVNNREQVEDLLQKIDSMIQLNGGGHYSTEIFENAYKFRRDEEIKRIRQGEKANDSEFKAFYIKNQHLFVHGTVVFAVAAALFGAVVAAATGFFGTGTDSTQEKPDKGK